MKLRDDRTGKYLAGTVQDYSVGGAMVRLEPGASLAIGHRVALGIGHGDQPILQAANMTSATVVRALANQRVHHVAVRFDKPTPLKQAG